MPIDTRKEDVVDLAVQVRQMATDFDLAVGAFSRGHLTAAIVLMSYTDLRLGVEDLGAKLVDLRDNP